MNTRFFTGSRSNRFTNLSRLILSMCFQLNIGCISSSGISSVSDEPPVQLPAKTDSHPCPSGGLCENFRRQLARVCERMKEDVALSPNPVPELFMEHTLDSDTRRIASQAALKDVDIAFHAAACAAYASDLQLAKQSLKRSLEYLERWSAIYIPQGNPVNDSYLLPMLFAARLIWPQILEAKRSNLSTWIRGFITQGDRFYAGEIDAGSRRIVHPDSDSRVKNNWQTWRLAIRSSAVTILNDQREIEVTADLIAQLIEVNLNSDGSSYDFLQRDALHYHVYDLDAWTQIAIVAPKVLTTHHRERIQQAFLFMKPYYEGTREHIEFANSKVPFDAERREAGKPEYQNVPWKPEGANKLLRLARCVFPATSSWTTDLERSQSASPRIKLLAALLCES